MWRFLAVAAVLCAFQAAAAAETFLVLPFFNHTNQSNLDWIGESLAEDLRVTLLRQGLPAVPRQDRDEAYRRLAVRPYARLTKATVIKIAEVLGAAQVIYGRFELTPGASKSLGTLQVKAQLLDLNQLRSGPEISVLGAMEDLAAVQTHLAWRVLQQAIPQQAPSEEEFRRGRRPVRVDALENYVRGLLAATEEQKHRFFTQAARLDPGFSSPCFELGMIHWEKENYGAASEWLAKVSPADPHFREATFYRGLSRFYLADYASAQAAFEQVAREVPLNEVFNNLGAVQSLQNLPEALANFRKALEGDGNDPDYHFNLGIALWKRGDFQAAAQSFRATLERDPEDEEATLLLGMCLAGKPYRPGDPKTDGLERVKHEYPEAAYLQLQAILEKGKK